MIIPIGLIGWGIYELGLKSEAKQRRGKYLVAAGGGLMLINFFLVSQVLSIGQSRASGGMSGKRKLLEQRRAK